MKKARGQRLLAKVQPPSWMEKRVKSLSDSLSNCDDTAKREALRAELSKLRRTLEAFSVVKPDRSPEASRVPLSKSYIEERRAKIEEAARVSKRKGMHVSFVQGGAPGSGGGGKGK